MDDPLWLGSPAKRRAFRWGCYAAALLWAWWMPAPLHWLGILFLAAALRLAMPAWFGWVEMRWRELIWRDREGAHFSFAGEALDVHDDGRAVWLHERGLRKLLGLQHDPPDAFKARFAGQWREARELGLDGRGLWLNAQGVHGYLAAAPERMDPRRVKLRTYIDREILQPAARRRGR
jgi:hypothetical protein